ncbi:MAG: MBL fold metallo-hydrolase [Alphaproteobacteria bacterium]
MPVARLRPISRHVAAVDLHGRFQVAVFLVRHEQGLALVDAGFPGWEYAVLTAAESLPQPNRITTVLLTHAHADHVGAAAAIVAQTEAEVVCGAAEKDYVEGRSLSRSARGVLPRLVLAVQHWTNRGKVAPIRVDRTVRDGDLVCGLRVVEVPGHTPGQIAFVHERDRVLLCADALFNVGERLGYDPVPGMTADVARADATLRRLADLGIADVVPSHGPAILGDGPERIRRFLAERGA